MDTTMAESSNQIQYHIADAAVPITATMFTSNQLQQSQFAHHGDQLGVVGVATGSPDQVHVETHHIVAQVSNQHQNANEMYVRHPVMEVETVVSLEQCCSCSTFFEAPSRPIPQPDLNRMICRVLEVAPEVSFFREYLALCVNCINLLRKFDRLRVELEFVKTQIVTYVMESLTQIKVDGGSQLDGLRNQIMDRWGFGQKESRKKGKGKEGFTAVGSNVELSWAAHNNVMRNSVTVTVTPSENWTPRSDVGASSPPNSPMAAEYSNDNDHADDFHNEDDASNGVLETTTENMEVPEIKDTTIIDNKNVPTGKSNTAVPAVLKPKRKKKKKIKKKRTGPEMVPLICVNCGRIFTQRISYNGHIQACTSDDLGNEKSCTVCNEEDRPCLFDTWVEYKTHVDTYHPLVKLDMCTKCSTVFLPNGLKRHSCWHRGHVATEAIFKCDRCDRAYNTRGNLVDHVRRVHKDEQHKCDICDKVYGSPMLLGFHVERHKRRISKFQCKYCGICLSTNYGLKEHTKLHTGEKPAECKECGKKFTSRSILRTHQTIHTNKKPHICHICGKCFKLKSSLSRHIPRHQIQETNYTKKCPLCPKSMFRRIWVLKKHMETSHPGTAELEDILEKYKDIDDAPKNRPLCLYTLKKGKGRAQAVKRLKESDDEETDDESDLDEDLDDELDDEENSSGAEDVKPTIDEDESKDSVPPPPSRQSARLMGKGRTKNVVVLLTKVSSKNSEDSVKK